MARQGGGTKGGPGEPRSEKGISRRRFITLGAAGAAAAVGSQHGLVALAASGPAVAQAVGRGPTMTVMLRRRDDQLSLLFELWNLRLDTRRDQSELVRAGSGDAHVVVVFPPQHVQEEAFYEADPNLEDDDAPPGAEPPSEPPVGARIAGPTRLAFKVPNSIASIPFTADALLDWDQWVPSVVPVARASAAVQPIGAFEIVPRLRAPSFTQTAIELPWWLVLSPHQQTGWLHATGPVTRDGTTELWHSRMGGRAPAGETDETDRARMTIRAVWARDRSFPHWLNDQDSVDPPGGEAFVPFHPIGMPFRTPLSPADRFDLVVSTSDYEHKVSESTYLPLPAQVNRLMLSPLGAWLDAHGAWDFTTSGTSLEAWRHQATLGRDHYVRVVRAGYLFPFGHAASLIKVSERKFRTISGGRLSGRRIAYLFQRYFIVVRQRRLGYGGTFQPSQGRGFPFSEVAITTSITPNLDPPGGQPPVGQNDQIFVPKVGNQPFLFHMVGTDRAGRSIDFEAAAVFVDRELAHDSTGDMDDLRDWYNEDLAETAPERTFQLDGARVAVAPPDAPGSTDIEIRRFTLGTEAPTVSNEVQLEAANQPAFFPTMAEATIRLVAAEVAVGGAVGSAPVVVLYPDYVQNGFDGPGEVFVALKDTGNPAGLDFGASQAGDRSGGVVTPNIGITALSRQTGTVGGPPAQFDGGSFDPTAFFPGSATLLGDITLQDVINLVSGTDFLTDPAKRDKVIQLDTKEVGGNVVTELRWLPEMKDIPGLFIASIGNQGSVLDLRATITIPKDNPGGATSVVVGDLRTFQVWLLPGTTFIKVLFDRLRFQAETGKKSDVDVEIREVVFAGPLEFVNDLKDYLTFSSDGFSIDLKPTHLAAGFAIPLPNISVGVFSLSNITFGAGTTIPFTGQPVRFRFSFSTKDNPFLLTVWIFGGGGFFELGIGVDGVEEFQAALEFGVAAAMDIGVASGSISIMAGIYLAIGIATPANPDGACELSGYIRLKGQVEVLGLITLSLLMEAGFTYIPDTRKALVRALIIVEIDLLIFSGSVEVEYEKRFGGSNDPVFHEAIAPADWDRYVDAFAPIGV